jgi:hypothetical protein
MSVPLSVFSWLSEIFLLCSGFRARAVGLAFAFVRVLRKLYDVLCQAGTRQYVCILTV